MKTSKKNSLNKFNLDIKKIPNIITAIRIILIPIILVLLIVSQLTISSKLFISIDDWYINKLWIAGAVLFIIAAVTDWLDGYLARKFKAVSDFGKLFDPIADKMLVNGVLIVLMLYPSRNTIPIWIGVIFILRDIYMNGIRMYLGSKNIIIAADWFGKLKTIFQLIGIIVILFIAPAFMTWNINSWESYIVLIPLYIGLVFCLVSAINYSYKSIKILK